MQMPLTLAMLVVLSLLLQLSLCLLPADGGCVLEGAGEESGGCHQKGLQVHCWQVSARDPLMLPTWHQLVQQLLRYLRAPA